MFNNIGWFSLIAEMHPAILRWIYPFFGLYLILYAIRLIQYIIYGRS